MISPQGHSHEREDDEAHDRDSDRVHSWVKEGKTLPLTQILKKNKIEGRLLDVEVKKQGDTIIYELEIINPDSVVYTLKVNARNGQLMNNHHNSNQDNQI
ncbi:PepSY domain-containing protein [Gynuella sp.]|uniref:PepSY domain-containing protein n=1 Tax=Gynuella sp. TaxID=2969146 RepID=UPI003D109ACF